MDHDFIRERLLWLAASGIVLGLAAYVAFVRRLARETDTAIRELRGTAKAAVMLACFLAFLVAVGWLIHRLTGFPGRTWLLPPWLNFGAVAGMAAAGTVAVASWVHSFVLRRRRERA